MWQSPESQKVQASGPSTPHTGCCVCMDGHLLGPNRTSFFFHSHCGHLTFEGQWIVLGGWWCSLELWV